MRYMHGIRLFDNPIQIIVMLRYISIHHYGLLQIILIIMICLVK